MYKPTFLPCQFVGNLFFEFLKIYGIGWVKIDKIRIEDLKCYVKNMWKREFGKYGNSVKIGESVTGKEKKKEI